MSEKALQQILSKLDTVANDITDLKSESKEIKETVSRMKMKQDIIYLQTGQLS